MRCTCSIWVCGSEAVERASTHETWAVVAPVCMWARLFSRVSCLVQVRRVVYFPVNKANIQAVWRPGRSSPAKLASTVHLPPLSPLVCEHVSAVHAAQGQQLRWFLQSTTRAAEEEARDPTQRSDGNDDGRW
jgi:hypothetical protein